MKPRKKIAKETEKKNVALKKMKEKVLNDKKKWIKQRDQERNSSVTKTDRIRRK